MRRIYTCAKNPGKQFLVNHSSLNETKLVMFKNVNVNFSTARCMFAHITINHTNNQKYDWMFYTYVGVTLSAAFGIINILKFIDDDNTYDQIFSNPEVPIKVHIIDNRITFSKNSKYSITFRTINRAVAFLNKAKHAKNEITVNINKISTKSKFYEMIFNLEGLIINVDVDDFYDFKNEDLNRINSKMNEFISSRNYLHIRNRIDFLRKNNNLIKLLKANKLSDHLVRIADVTGTNTINVNYWDYQDADELIKISDEIINPITIQINNKKFINHDAMSNVYCLTKGKIRLNGVDNKNYEYIDVPKNESIHKVLKSQHLTEIKINNFKSKFLKNLIDTLPKYNQLDTIYFSINVDNEPKSNNLINEMIKNNIPVKLNYGSDNNYMLIKREDVIIAFDNNFEQIHNFEQIQNDSTKMHDKNLTLILENNNNYETIEKFANVVSNTRYKSFTLKNTNDNNLDQIRDNFNKLFCVLPEYIIEDNSGKKIKVCNTLLHTF